MSLVRSQTFIPFSQATYKLSSIGVEVHGLCDLEYIGMDFIKWYIGGQATKACRVYAVALRKYAENGTCVLTKYSIICKMICKTELHFYYIDQSKN